MPNPQVVHLARLLSDVPGANQLMMTYEVKGASNFLDLSREVLLLGPSQKVAEGLADYTLKARPNLLVIGSDVGELGSVAMGVAAEVDCPILIVKAKLSDGAPIKYCLAVDTSAIPALRFTCSLMRPQDSLVLLRASPRDEGMSPTSSHQRLIATFLDVAIGEGCCARSVVASGKLVDVLPSSSRSLKIDVLVMQAPKLKTLSDAIKKVVVAAPSSVLVYKADQASTRR